MSTNPELPWKEEIRSKLDAAFQRFESAEQWLIHIKDVAADIKAQQIELRVGLAQYRDEIHDVRIELDRRITLSMEQLRAEIKAGDTALRLETDGLRERYSARMHLMDLRQDKLEHRASVWDKLALLSVPLAVALWWVLGKVWPVGK